MNILYLTNIPSPYKIDFLNELNSKVCVTCIFTKNNDDIRDNRWFSNIQMNFPFFQIKNGDYSKLKKIINEKKYDFAINDLYASLNGILFEKECKKHNIIYFINAEGGFSRKNENIISSFLKSHFLQKADYYLSSGKETNKYLTYYGAKENKIYTYPFTSLYKNDILKEPISYDEKLATRKKNGYSYKRLFISVGNFIYRKGYDLFLDAIKNLQLEDVAFIIVGSGKEKNHYLNMIAQNNIKNVFFVDFCQKKELFELLKMSDVFFFPSREDIWGLVINEAMACGLPIISSNNVIASLELIDKDFLYNPNNINDQKEIIKKVSSLSNEQLYSIGKRNINVINDYTIENMANKYLEIFERIK